MSRAAPRAPAGVVPSGAQQIRFTQTRDGVRIAHARHGSGPPLVVVACWLSHLQHDWQSPVWRHFLEDLGAFTTLIRYDLRGHGLSDRDVDDFSLELMLNDLDAVVADQGLERFALMGMSGNSPIAVAYAARHPDRVTRLVMYGGTTGSVQADTPEERDEEAAWQAMLRAGWARPDPKFRRVFTQAFIPDATEEQMRWFDDLQRTSTSAATVVAARMARLSTRVTDEARTVKAPTMVLHALHDDVVPFARGRETAGVIPGARLVPLESRNHILLAGEPAWPVLVAELQRFMAPDRAATATDPAGAAAVATLSRREHEVLGLAADGTANAEIASALGLSVRTIERHLSNAYLKLGLTGKAARTGAVAALLRTTR